MMVAMRNDTSTLSTDLHKLLPIRIRADRCIETTQDLVCYTAITLGSYINV